MCLLEVSVNARITCRFSFGLLFFASRREDSCCLLFLGIEEAEGDKEETGKEEKGLTIWETGAYVRLLANEMNVSGWRFEFAEMYWERGVSDANTDGNVYAQKQAYELVITYRLYACGLMRGL